MSNFRIHYLQHEDFEGLGCIEQWAKTYHYKVSDTKLYLNQKIPDLDSFDCLIIMGGPMSANDDDKYVWMREEKKIIKKSIEKGKMVVGICLGAQLIANVLGAKVYPNNHKEIGWFEVRKTSKHELIKDFAETSEFLHWHGDTFDLPVGAERLFESEATKNQAFLYKNHVLGLQFHPEITEIGLKDLLENCRNELIQDKFIQSEQEILSKIKNCKISHAKLFALLEKLKNQYKN